MQLNVIRRGFEIAKIYSHLDVDFYCILFGCWAWMETNDANEKPILQLIRYLLLCQDIDYLLIPFNSYSRIWQRDFFLSKKCPRSEICGIECIQYETLFLKLKSIYSMHAIAEFLLLYFLFHLFRYFVSPAVHSLSTHRNFIC